jgi:nucleoside permease NupC
MAVIARSLPGTAVLLLIAFIFSTSRRTVARYGLRAAHAGTLSNLMGAIIAGIFMTLN